MNQRQVGFWQLVFGVLALFYAVASIVAIGGGIFSLYWDNVSLLWLYFGLFAVITGLYDLKASKTESKKKE